ncbi:MAG: hypothetical protein E6K06_01505 [Methanobacteriota archaeon]|nr:MAG: hypothetical protein E6K09_05480 [Euryarchaeota archaeon]TLZ74127.1 MAG: hypothetical protein E6K06_01505 [Euryarchaeota archaeon]
MRDLVESPRENKVIEENHTIRVLAERNGVLISLTTKRYSYLLFFSRPLIGVRKIITRDKIVARAGYDIRRTRDLIDEIYGRGGL